MRPATVTAIENPSTSAGQPPSPTPGDHVLHASRKDTAEVADTTHSGCRRGGAGRHHSLVPRRARPARAGMNSFVRVGSSIDTLDDRPRGPAMTRPRSRFALRRAMVAVALVAGLAW